MTSDETKIAALEKINGELLGKAQLLSERITILQQGMISAALRTAAKAAGVGESAIDDVLMRAGIFEVTADGGAIRAKEGVGLKPGITPEKWLDEVRAQYPHWWPAPEKSNHNDSKENPWAKDSWNFTRQGDFLKKHGMEKAERMAKLAGTTVGGLKPGTR